MISGNGKEAKQLLDAIRNVMQLPDNVISFEISGAFDDVVQASVKYYPEFIKQEVAGETHGGDEG